MKYQYTSQEKEKIISNFMEQGKVVKVPAKEKKKYILLDEFVNRFEEGKIYTDKEINFELLTMYPVEEYVEQRRYLITFGFFERTNDGSQYWLNPKK
ncbi:DUF2087 domain-containing protein [Marinilactibacillus psychrotolerans]|uniref:Transcriptional regulator n=1 Tax=Marinilactibacillus psychrotolerans TaxID=191770 RepID=A0AAV3WRF3_9LACT|nr:DUF2087 domain-containing protein [Marinilactibacillus psychrotolerans]GEL66880.1 transcriptional regulator [Marinilactibacillus psychrotolerans]GEQ35962.1 transcriptional regulator [Marinilactibacillus psychrotolerans]SDC41282.1 hypothetical protein SAMN04488013_10533 [Marinilactibacillus psychrotolerans]